MIEVVVETIVSQRDFGVIFSATVVAEDCAHHGIRIRVKVPQGAITWMPAAGEAWLVDGEISEGEHGSQVAARGVTRRLSAGALIRGFLTTSVQNIGQERAGRLWQAFGPELPAVLDDPGNVARIAAVLAPERPLLSLRLAAAAIAGWRDARAEAGLVAWLDAHGVRDVPLVRKLGRMLGVDAVRLLDDNPYILVPLQPWPKVDGLGIRILAAAGAEAATDVRRHVGAVDEAVKRTLLRGDTALSEEDLRKIVGKALSVD